MPIIRNLTSQPVRRPDQISNIWTCLIVMMQRLISVAHLSLSTSRMTDAHIDNHHN